MQIVGDALVGVTLARVAFSTAFIFVLILWVVKFGLQNTFINILVIAIVTLMVLLSFCDTEMQFGAWLFLEIYIMQLQRIKKEFRLASYHCI
jgi:hypothetical protein